LLFFRIRLGCDDNLIHGQAQRRQINVQTTLLVLSEGDVDFQLLIPDVGDLDNVGPRGQPRDGVVPTVVGGRADQGVFQSYVGQKQGLP